MTRMEIIFCLAVGLVALCVVTVNSACGKCASVSKAACLNETGFAICFDGMNMSDTIGVCPPGQVCTEKVGICKPRYTDNPTCGKCNACFQNFSCKSRTQFEFCNGNILTGVVVKCPGGQYCNITNLVKSHNICAQSCSWEPWCYADEVPDPTYKDVCTGKADKGAYDNIYDATCKTYVYCEELNLTMNAILYTCPSGYFDPVLIKCTADIPARCA